jgi:hypothetical protein
MGAASMTLSYDAPDIQSIFAKTCLRKFKYLSEYGFRLAGIERDSYGIEVTYKNRTTGIKISFEIRENDITVYLIRLVNGEIPEYLDAPSRWFYLDNLVKLRASATELPRKEGSSWFTPDEVDRVLGVYAELLNQYGLDVLHGHFSVFAELAREVARPALPNSIERIDPITSSEELSAQKERLPTQIIEYYDTYFSELRSYLMNPDLFADAVPDSLKGYKRVISIGSKDGLVVAHFPIDLEITVSAEGRGNAVMRFPSIHNAKDDSYEFIQLPNVPVREVVNLVSGGEDVEIDFPPEGVPWGVRGFSAPQQKVDLTTGDLAWQAPWTQLIAADLHYLRFWESTERARREAREDVEPYLRGPKHHSAPTEQYEIGVIENIEEAQLEADEPSIGTEELLVSRLGTARLGRSFATLPEHASFRFG